MKMIKVYSPERGIRYVKPNHERKLTWQSQSIVTLVKLKPSTTLELMESLYIGSKYFALFTKRLEKLETMGHIKRDGNLWKSYEG